MADVASPRKGPAANVAAVAVPSPRAGTWLLAGAVMVLLQIAPALWNGFPFIFPDTGGYLARPFEGALVMGRSAFYGLFLYVSVPLAFWPVIVAQAALMVWLIALTMRALALGGRPWLTTAIVLLLAAGTSLPWFAGQLMPDILFPAAVLALYLLIFRAAVLSRGEIAGLIAVVAVAMASHMAALALCIGVVGALALLSRLKTLASARPRLPLAAAAAGAGIALCLLSNLAIAGKFTFTPGGASFVFARLVEDGIIARYVKERCPDPSLRICAHANEIPDNADAWVWGDTAFYELGGAQGFGDEAQRIVLDTLKRYPFMHLKAAIADVARQLVMFKTELRIRDNEPTLDTIADRTPQLMPALKRARQQAAPFDVSLLNYIHVPLAALSLVGLLGVLVLRRKIDLAPELYAFGMTIVVALIVNAAVNALFAHAIDRYQSRLVLLAPFAVAVMAARRAPRLGRQSDFA